MVLGNISPNVNIKKVNAPEATAIATSPNLSAIITVNTPEEVIFTKLLPIKMVINSLSLFSIKVARDFEPGFFCFFNA
jgi:hypothetical protein